MILASLAAFAVTYACTITVEQQQPDDPARRAYVHHVAEVGFTAEQLATPFPPATAPFTLAAADARPVVRHPEGAGAYPFESDFALAGTLTFVSGVMSLQATLATQGLVLDGTAFGVGPFLGFQAEDVLIASARARQPGHPTLAQPVGFQIDCRKQPRP
jgi:hypothetical protein